MLSLIHIAHKRKAGIFPEVFLEALKPIGELKIIEQGVDLSDEEKIALFQEHDVALTGWNSAGVPAAIVANPGKLKYVCNLTGEMSGFIPPEIVESDILVSNWGDTPAIAVAEGTVALLLASLKDLHSQIININEGGWSLKGKQFGGSLFNASLGIYGCGVIGRRFVEIVKGFNPDITIFDPYCETLPEGCTRVDSLKELFQKNQIISIFAGLSDETRSSVNSEMLSYLPDGGVVINTARGGIIDQEALFAELETGRLRAGLDVLEPDGLEKGHPARSYKNLILSCHDINRGWAHTEETEKKLGYMHQVCIANLSAFSQSKPIKFEMDPVRFNRST